jgi:hypothetical protein
VQAVDFSVVRLQEGDRRWAHRIDRAEFLIPVVPEGGSSDGDVPVIAGGLRSRRCAESCRQDDGGGCDSRRELMNLHSITLTVRLYSSTESHQGKDSVARAFPV